MRKPKQLTESDQQMLISLYTYGMGGKWYQELVEKYGQEKIDKEEAKLAAMYEVRHNVYEDSEGCTYNELVPISNN